MLGVYLHVSCPAGAMELVQTHTPSYHRTLRSVRKQNTMYEKSKGNHKFILMNTTKK